MPFIRYAENAQNLNIGLILRKGFRLEFVVNDFEGGIYKFSRFRRRAVNYGQLTDLNLQSEPL